MRTSNYWRGLNKAGIRRIIIAGAGILLAGILFFFIYFKVEHVEIQEGSHYSKGEVQEMALKGPLAFNSVLAPILYSRPVENMAFLEAIEVDQVNRNTILVSVKEKKPVGCIKYLDCYMYFDRAGKIIESSIELDRKVPYFDGLDVESVVIGEVLPVKETVLNTAVSLVRIFQKNDTIPDHIVFDSKSNITLQYEDVQAELGKDMYLEEKMARLLAILPKLTGKKGILHLESVTASGNRNITFEEEKVEEDSSEDQSTSAEGTSSEGSYNAQENDIGDESSTDSQYDAYGNYIGDEDSTDSQYDAYGNYIGDGSSQYDAYGNYIGDSQYDAYGNYIGDSQYDAYGNYIGDGSSQYDAYGNYIGDGSSQYDAYGNYVGDSQYDAYGNYVGDSQYDAYGNYTGGSQYDAYGNYIGDGTYTYTYGY